MAATIVHEPDLKHIHTEIANIIQRTIESVILTDWREITPEDLIQAAARLRTIKARYIVSRTHPDHQQILSPLDEALIGIYTGLDMLQGRDATKQRELYRALLDAQSPLLLAYALLPSSQSDQFANQDEHERGSDHDNVSPLDEPSHQEKAARVRSSWNKEQILLIQHAIEENNQKEKRHRCTANALGIALAKKHDWPERATVSKVYELFNKRGNVSRVSNRESKPSDQEDDRSEADQVESKEAEG